MLLYFTSFDLLRDQIATLEHNQIVTLRQIASFCFLSGICWIGVVAFKRGKSLGWSNFTCYITSFLLALSPIILISIPIHFVLWLSSGDK